MGKEYDINNLYQLAFGYVAPPYPWGGVPDPANLIPLRSYVLGGKAQNQEAIRMATVLSIPGFTYPLPNEPIIQIDGGREVVVGMPYGMTMSNAGGVSVNSNRGSTKEIPAYKDWSITIEGLIVNLDEDDYPEEELKQLQQILEYNGPITIQNDACRTKGITQVVALDWSFPREAGEGVRYQRYRIDLLSDNDYELEIL